MKKYLVLALLPELLFACCKNTNHAETTDGSPCGTTTTASATETTRPAEIELDENAPRKMKITGMVEVADTGEVYVVEKWQTRSRVTYVVTGDLVSEVKAREGDVITVTGNVVKQSMWSGTIEVLKIEQ
jgi:hypothetical protein